MRKLLTIMAAAGVLAMGGLAAGCSGQTRTESPPAAEAAPAASVQYHCAMHPEVVSSAPGTCPRCHMALTKK